MKSSDGKYHINGMIFEILIGSRAQVHHGTAYKTPGGLKKNNLKKNKHGKIVSRAKSAKGAQMLKRLTNKGYHTRKGKFGWVKGKDTPHLRGEGSGTRKHSKKHRRHSKKRRGHSKKHRGSKHKVHPIYGVGWEDRAYGTGRFAKKPSYRRRR